MTFQAEIMKDVSFDPYFKIKFSYESNNIAIKEGFAEVIRKAPKPDILFVQHTDEKIMQMDRSKLELELLNAIIEYLLSNGQKRTFRRRVVLDVAG